MTYLKLKNKTPKQLKTFLYNNGWNKKYIQQLLRELTTEMTGDCLNIVNAVIDNWTFEHLLTMYHDEVVEYIWEEICNA